MEDRARSKPTSCNGFLSPVTVPATLAPAVSQICAPVNPPAGNMSAGLVVRLKLPAGWGVPLFASVIAVFIAVFSSVRLAKVAFLFNLTVMPVEVTVASAITPAGRLSERSRSEMLPSVVVLVAVKVY